MLDHERPKLDRYRSHLFLTAYGVQLDTGTGELATSELSAFITPRALITVRKDDGLDIGAVTERWDASPDLAKHGVGYLLHGLIDFIVDEPLRGGAGPGRLHRGPGGPAVLRRPAGPRGAAAQLRAAQEPGAAAPGGPAHARGGQHPDAPRPARRRRDDLHPYFQDVYDHVLRATEWTESLRDLVTTILETNLTIQGNRLNVITKKVTGWAAIIAVPTLITGFYGMNVPYPGFGRKSRLRCLRRHHCPDRASALPHLQTQGLAVRPKILDPGRGVVAGRGNSPRS